jgi:hypothetical protein
MFSRIIFTIFLISINFFSYAENKTNHPLIKEGDLIFQETDSEQSKAVKLATHSPFTHVGIIFKYGNEFKVLEAVQPVKITPLDTFIFRSKNNLFEVKRLKNYTHILTTNNIIKLKQKGESYIGKDYDLYFEWSNDKMYCSELVWKLYNDVLGIQIGKLGKLSDFDLNDPLVKNILEQRYGSNIPYNEKVISPASMYKSNLLFTVKL